MRLRVVIAITLTVIAYVAIAFAWRLVFPFRDGLAEFLPDGTIAYVHVNLTARVHRAIAFQISDFRFQIGEVLADTLTAALRSPDVRELGLVWFHASTNGFGVQATDIVPPRIALLIGQRASPRSDVLAPASFTVGGTELRLHVIRTRSGAPVHRLPMQATLHPRALPIPALEAGAHLMPEVVAASGTIGRRGFTVRSDDWRPWFRRDIRIPLLVSPSAGALQILNLPIREILNGITAPTHRELLAGIAAVIPDTVDAVVARDGFALRLPGTDLANERTRDAIRAVVARAFPSVRTRVLDGIPTETFAADPSSVTITPVGANRWLIRAQDRDAATAERIGHGIVIATSPALRDAVITGDGTTLRIPAGCAQRPPVARGAMLVVTIHPQFIAVLTRNRDGSQFAICGGNLGS